VLVSATVKDHYWLIAFKKCKHLLLKSNIDIARKWSSHPSFCFSFSFHHTHTYCTIIQESGTLHALKDRWWKQKRGGGACSDESKKGSAVNELSLGNVGGVFVVLLGGFAFSLIVALCEFMWRARKLAPDKVSVLCVCVCAWMCE